MPSTYDPHYVYVNQYFLLGVKCFIENPTKQILLLRRSKLMSKKWPDSWSLPGGAVDHGESLEEACAREIMEEVGIAVDALSFHHSISFTEEKDQAMMSYFTGHVRANDTHLNWEHDMAQWASPSDAMKILTGIHRDALQRIYHL